MKKTSAYPAAQRAINEDIKNATFQPCYLIYGDEAYLRLQNTVKLREAMCKEGDTMNVLKTGGEDVDAGALVDFAMTMPFFADRRVIIVRDSGFFKSGSDELVAYFKGDFADTATFVFEESVIDKRTALYKAVSKIGRTIDCEVQPEGTLRKWIGSLILKEGKSIDDDAAALLLSSVGTDMFNLSHEVEKLIAYTDGRSEITLQDVEAVKANWIFGEIFAMTDAIVEKNRVRAMQLYLDLLAMKEPAPRIAYLITRQFYIMLQVKEMAQQGRDTSAIASAVQLAPYIAGKYLRWSKAFSPERLKEILDLCLLNEKAVKTGQLDANIAVELTIQGCTE